MMRNSPDEQIREARIVTCSGRKWSAPKTLKTVNQVESNLKDKGTVGMIAVICQLMLPKPFCGARLVNRKEEQ